MEIDEFVERWREAEERAAEARRLGIRRETREAAHEAQARASHIRADLVSALQPHSDTVLSLEAIGLAGFVLAALLRSQEP